MDFGFLILQLPWSPRSQARRAEGEAKILGIPHSEIQSAASATGIPPGKTPSDLGVHKDYPGLLVTRPLRIRHIDPGESHELPIPTLRSCVISTPVSTDTKFSFLTDRPLLVPPLNSTADREMQLQIPQVSPLDVGQGNLTSGFQNRRLELDAWHWSERPKAKW